MEIGTGDILGFIKMLKENLHKLHCFCFVFAQSFKLDMDPRLKGSWIRIHI